MTKRSKFQKYFKSILELCPFWYFGPSTTETFSTFDTFCFDMCITWARTCLLFKELLVFDRLSLYLLPHCCQSRGCNVLFSFLVASRFRSFAL